MYTIQGKILIKENGQGIGNLQVVLYDIEHAKSPKEWSEIFTFPDTKGLWQTIPGERLGSVLTELNGTFQLVFEEDSFSAGEHVKGPDLLLMVLAPEEEDISTAQRILHVSRDVVANSGKKESYIIRVPQSSLAKHGINDSKTPSAVENIKKSNQVYKEIKQALEEESKEKIAKGLALKTAVNRSLESFTFSKIPAATRSSDTYLNPKEKISDKTKLVVERTLKEIPLKDSTVKKKVVLNLTDEELQQLGTTMGDGQEEGTVELGKILQIIGPSFTAGTLNERFPGISACSREAKAEHLFKCHLEKCKNEKDDCVSNAGTPCETRQEIPFSLGEQISRQTSFTAAPEKELSYGVERDGKIIATITVPGPTDNIAFHDFQSLEIAFDTIWTEAFDPSLAAAAGRVASEMIRLSNRVSGTGELPPIEDISRMRELYQYYQELNEFIEQEEKAEDPIASQETIPSLILQFLPDMKMNDWNELESGQKAELARMANEFVTLDSISKITGHDAVEVATLGVSSAITAELEGKMSILKDQAKVIITQGKELARERELAEVQKAIAPTRQSPVNSRLKRLMEDLDRMLGEPHKFDIFSPDSVNFGLLFDYRQTWVPKNYQVGELVSTLPLAPKEVRKYATKKVIKKNRAQKQIEDHQSTQSSESNETTRADAEIVKQAKNNTSFEQTTNLTLTVGVIQGQFGSRFGMQAEKTSSDTKKNFREAVVKAAEEFKRQVRLEVETTTSEELEVTSSAEIMNPNEEITVTYLFYELQRQYEISEKLHKLTPVILVANDVPFPEEINEAWLMAHDWILRRVILDESFLPALQYVATSQAGDEFALKILKDNVNRQVKLVEALTAQVTTKTDLATKAFDQLKRLMTFATSSADVDKMKEIGLAIALGPIALVGGGDDEAAEKREEITKVALERADKSVQEANAKLSTEVTALKDAVNKYTSALQELFDREAAITRLKLHIKQNILYYMQAIWDYEPSDQRYFRLYNIEVPWIDVENPSREVRISRGTSSRGPFSEISAVSTYHVEMDIIVNDLNTAPKKLHEIADLDTLLGFKGNYMIFPMKQNSYLHKYMMQDYIDVKTGGLKDPDQSSVNKTEDLLDYLCCLQKSSPEYFEANKEKLLNEFVRHQLNPETDSELIVVPANSLYIEALPGEYPILENFKLAHRALDVKKVQAEVRHAELENIRLAVRLAEGNREDPDIDKKITVQGSTSSIITPPEA